MGLLYLISPTMVVSSTKFDDGVGRMDGGAVMCEEGVEEGAEDPALWCSTLIVDDM